MIRFLLRLLGAVLLAGAVILAVLDATRSLAAQGLVVTPLAQAWADGWPTGYEAARGWVASHAGEGLWNGVVLPLLSLPGVAILGLLALLFFALGRKPAERSGWGGDPLFPARRRRI
ncbi:hypothetical protein NGM99_05810 [Mesorhizobium sp. RP14(2022)]|uniref:Uncharacterized protein n=1 Tax=Mesorhizobium liriopis TaxID=2953882 RepID=A0ABT1C398_9HYPH|nr:hypothetical protein [Mesorhizobium liriopis]MCO6049305.1 hypothetical protein [Mesorhizobium liriopis]